MKLVIKNTIAGSITGLIIGLLTFLLTFWMFISFLIGMIVFFFGKAPLVNYDLVYILLLTGVLSGLGLLAILISVEDER